MAYYFTIYTHLNAFLFSLNALLTFLGPENRIIFVFLPRANTILSDCILRI
jgi:hypothetical protein